MSAPAGSSPSAERRALLALLAACGLAHAGPSMAALDDHVFGATSFDDALRALGSVTAGATQLQLDLPDAVENGALVPVSVTSALPGTTELFVVVELNPNPLAAKFVIPAGTEPYLATRIKVAQSCRVHAIAKAGGRLYATARHTQVTVGGCA